MKRIILFFFLLLLVSCITTSSNQGAGNNNEINSIPNVDFISRLLEISKIEDEQERLANYDEIVNLYTFLHDFELESHWITYRSQDSVDNDKNYVFTCVQNNPFDTDSLNIKLKIAYTYNLRNPADKKAVIVFDSTRLLNTFLWKDVITVTANFDNGNAVSIEWGKSKNDGNIYICTNPNLFIQQLLLGDTLNAEFAHGDKLFQESFNIKNLTSTLYLNEISPDDLLQAID